MKITSIKPVGKKPVYDLSIDTENYDEQQYILENGVVSHNTGIYYSADNIWILGRQQEKKGTDVVGYNFVINVEKSRYVKEKSKIPITVSWEGGVQKWSGLTEVGIAGGYVRKPSMGWYEAINPATGEVLSGKVRMNDTLKGEFWEDIFNKTDFKEFVKKQYSIGHESLVNMDDIIDIVQEEE